MSVRQPPESPFVARLASDLRSRLGAIEAEADRIRDALAILDWRVQRRSGKWSRPRANLPERLLAALEGHPGTRASLLALDNCEEAHEITAVLERMQAAGMVERDGLGWRRRR